MRRTQKTSAASEAPYKGKHRHQHWYRDRQVYFLVARCRSAFPAFAHEDAKSIFWDRFDHYTAAHGFTPWIVSLLDNHYHAIGYLERAADLRPMMNKLHGSIAKLVNDHLEARRIQCPPPTFQIAKTIRRAHPRPPRRGVLKDPPPHSPESRDSPEPLKPKDFRLLPFWRESKRHNYFDGLLRDRLQLTRSWRYTLFQCRRHAICPDPAAYPHTRTYLPLDSALAFAVDQGALLEGVRYRRYELRDRPSAAQPREIR